MILIIISCTFPYISKAAVIINEIAWMGTKNSASDEWIELYSDQEISLSGWTLEAEDGTPSIDLEGGIQTNGYFLLERTNDESVPDITADQIYTGALSNSGEYLKLKDSNNNTIEEINCSGGWFAGDNSTKQTMERMSSSWQISLNPEGTPRALNSGSEKLEEESQKPEDPEEEPGNKLNQLTEEPDLPDGKTDESPIADDENNIVVFISEFLPSPAGKDADQEWIEIYNDSDQVVDISGWQLDDEEKGSKPFVFPEDTLINSKSYSVFSRQVTSIALNNDGDEVRLLLPDGSVFQEITYEKAPEGQSSTRTPEGFIWSTPTPGLPNIIEQESPQIKTTSYEDSLKNSTKKDLSSRQYYNLANLEESRGSSSKLVLIIITIAAIAITIGIGFIKFKKKKY